MFTSRSLYVIGTSLTAVMITDSLDNCEMRKEDTFMIFMLFQGIGAYY